jgi:hypothetical protein
VDQSRRSVRIPPPRLARGPGFYIDTERHAHGPHAERCDGCHHGRAGRGNARSCTQRQVLTYPAVPSEQAAITDIRDRDELATRHVYQRWNAKNRTGDYRNQSARARPDRMHQIEARGPVPGEYGAEGPHPCEWPTDVVDVCTGELPLPSLCLLVQSEDMHLVLARQPGEEGDQRRYYPILPGSVDTSGHYQSDSHLARAIPGPPAEVRTIRQARAHIKRPAESAQPS